MEYLEELKKIREEEKRKEIDDLKKMGKKKHKALKKKETDRKLKFEDINANDHIVHPKFPMVSRKQLFQNALEDANSFRRTRKLDTDDLGEIWGMCNQAGEYIMLEEAIQINQMIEGWMFSLEFAMKHAVSK